MMARPGVRGVFRNTRGVFLRFARAGTVNSEKRHSELSRNNRRYLRIPSTIEMPCQSDSTWSLRKS